ncbi:MAG: pyruvate, water dikinase regulatory protein [Anaerolineales bacterium]|nr:pyruvate, water dikinase regulatory protein [Anaerolineales bacterium]
MDNQGPEAVSSHPKVFVVSGGLGTLGENLARTVIAQFKDVHVSTEMFPRTNSKAQIDTIVDRAESEDALIVHSLVADEYRDYTIKQAGANGVENFDVVGPLLKSLSAKLGVEPLGRPGMYRQLHESYFKRIDAIEFTIEHDDGINPQGWGNAEIVLTGVSRVGKTPLSLYLSMLGWKVANVPIVMGIPPRQELFDLDPRRVVGILMDPSQVIQHRQVRQDRLNMGRLSSYSKPENIYEEMESAKKIFRKARIRTLDVTGKPIETSADEVINLVTRSLRREVQA